MTGCGKPHCLHCSVRKMLSDEDVDIHYTSECEELNHRKIVDETDMVELPNEELLKILKPVQSSIKKNDTNLICKTKTYLLTLSKKSAKTFMSQEFLDEFEELSNKSTATDDLNEFMSLRNDIKDMVTEQLHQIEMKVNDSRPRPGVA